MPNNAITISTESEFGVMVQQADLLVKSGFLPNSIRTPQQAVAIMMMGRELEIGPWAAFNGINVIQGKPTISPQLMLALINRSGELEDMTVEGDDKACTVTMTRKGRSPHGETFTMKDAAAQGLANKGNWQKMPATMLKWRAVSACSRVVFPDVIIGFYTPEEIDADVIVDMETGEVIEHSAPPQHTARRAEVVEASATLYGDDEDTDLAPRQTQPAPAQPKPAPAQQPKAHWIDDPKARARFWAYTKNELGLEKDEVYDALGVASLHDYAGSMQAAKDKLDTYADAKSSQPTGRPTRPEPPQPPPWAEDDDAQDTD